MRDILSKVVTGSMIAGAALLVAACGGGGSEANNTANTEMDAVDPMMEGTTNDVTAVDGANAGADANLGVDANVSVDVNATNTGADADAGNATNGM